MIYYRLETKLKGRALDKMMESIPPIIQYASNIIEQYSTVEDIINEMKELLPYNITNWMEHKWIPEFEVNIHINTSSNFGVHVIFDFRDVIRDIKIKKILE